MMSWLLVIIVSYLFFSIAFFGDKLILAGKSNAALYTFYIGVLSVLLVCLAPFINFTWPDSASILWIILDGVVYILGAYILFLALEKFEVSRVMPAIGATQPIFILILTLIFWDIQVFTGLNLLAFLLLFLGSITISLEKKFTITRKYLVLILSSSLLFSFDYIFSKLIFLHQPFLQGLIWMRISSFVLVLLFLLSKKFRQQLSLSLAFHKSKVKKAAHRKTGILFLLIQMAGGIAGILQSFAISLAPIGSLAIMNSLRGVQYIFLFLMTLFSSIFFPKILKEDLSKKIITQKLLSILLIIIGLAILAFY